MGWGAAQRTKLMVRSGGQVPGLAAETWGCLELQVALISVSRWSIFTAAQMPEAAGLHPLAQA